MWCLQGVPAGPTGCVTQTAHACAMQVRSGDGAAGDKRYLTYRRYLTPSQNSKIGEVLAGDCTVTAALASLLYSVADVSIIFKTQS